MSKLNSLFAKFLSNIEPDEDAVGYAQDAHNPVRDFLKSDEKFSEYVENTFLYGSYKRHTAVGDIKDVDIVVLTNFDTSDEQNTPQSVLRKLKAALARHYDDPDNQEYQRRSIRINDPLPDKPEVKMTLDIIPAVAPNGDDEPLLIPDKELKQWIQSHPTGHLTAISQLNREEYSGGRFVPLAKMMKWWWKYQCEERQPEVERPKPKGFWVECLTAENFDPTQTYWADSFIAVLKAIADKYNGVSEPPQLKDPGLPGQIIKTNMTADGFKVFMTAVNECLELAITARDIDDDVESSALWKDIFGEKFPLYEGEESTEKSITASEIKLGDTSHAARPPWQMLLSKKRKVRIDAFIYIGDVRQRGLNSDRFVLPDGRYIKFTAKTNVRGPYEVFWQVVNTGKHAKEKGVLRGDTFFKGHNKDFSVSNNQHVNWERTEYTGKHSIQCFVVQNGYCVARSTKFFISVKNAEYTG